VVLNDNPETTSVNCWLAVAAALSVTVAVKVKVPLAVAVPLTTPAALKVIPAGSAPPVSAHV
jgi:hypothetical protein